MSISRSAAALALLLTALTLTLATLGCQDLDAPGVLVMPTVDEDPDLPRVEVNGTALHVRTWGDPADPTVVLLHGGPGNGDFEVLLGLAPLAEEGYHVVAYDQRGAGQSRRHPADVYTVDLNVEDLDQLIDVVAAESEAETVALVGHSWGGQLAVAYTAAHPDRVHGLVLSEPGPLTGEVFADVADQVVDTNPFGAIPNHTLWSHGVVTPDSYARADYGLVLWNLEGATPGYHMVDYPFRRPGYHAWLGLQASLPTDGDGYPVFDLTDGVEAFRGEVLILRGERNTVLDAAYHERQAAFFEDATLVTLPGVGHDLPWTAREAHVERIADYLERNPSAAR